MKRYLVIMASLVTSNLFNVGYADIVIPESGLLVCTPDRPYTVYKENGSIGIEEGQKPCIVEAEENPFILYSIYKSDYCIDMDYIGSQCGKGGSGGSGEASGPFPDKLNWNDTNKLAEYNQGRYNTNRGQFFDKGTGGCVGGASLNFSGEISSMADCDDKDKKITALVPKPESSPANPAKKTSAELIKEFMLNDCAPNGRTSYSSCVRRINSDAKNPGGKFILTNALLGVFAANEEAIKAVFGTDTMEAVARIIRRIDATAEAPIRAYVAGIKGAEMLESAIKAMTGSALYPEIIRNADGRPIEIQGGIRIQPHDTRIKLSPTVYASVGILFLTDVTMDPDKRNPNGPLSSIVDKLKSVDLNWSSNFYIVLDIDNGVVDKLIAINYHISSRKTDDSYKPFSTGGKTYSKFINFGDILFLNVMW
ncbi:MAG: hypothetical protein U0Z75_09525 [Deinococcaceae bacterium]